MNESARADLTPVFFTYARAFLAGLGNDWGGQRAGRPLSDQAVAGTLASAGVPRDLIDRASWDAVGDVNLPDHCRPEVDAVKCWLDHRRPRPDLNLAGDVGVGKTMLCVLLARALVAQRERVTWVSSADLFRDIFERDLIERYRVADHLFLDDVGAEPQPITAAQGVFFGLVNHRWSHNLPIIWTCSKRMAVITALSNRYGPATASRLLDTRRTRSLSWTTNIDRRTNTVPKEFSS